MPITAGIILALAIGSIVLFSTLFVVILFQMRSRWDQLGSPSPRPPQDRPDNT